MLSNELIGRIEELMGPEAVLRDEPMSRHTTFRVGGPAKLFVRPDAVQLKDLLCLLREAGEEPVVIGNGSNLLVGDQGIDGVVIEIGARMGEIRISENELQTGAGALLSAAAAKALSAGLSGMECLSGIPGSIGGAVAMNAGAYGGEVRDILKEALVLTRNGSEERLTAGELDLSYRHSLVPKRGLIVVSAVFSLTPGDPEAIRAKMEELKEKRVSKQPLNFPSAGSAFKRPQGYFAGKLIEDAGLRGFRVGGACVSEKHCGFIVNDRGASAAEIRSLIGEVRRIVFENSGVELEPEIRMIGKF